MVKIGFGVNIKELNTRPHHLKTYYYIAERADDVGLGFLAFPNMICRGMPTFETWTYITTLATKTQWVGIATFVCQVPIYHPIILASRIASIDVVSEGRFIFGAGAGWFRPEVEGVFGVPWHERWDRFKECLEIIKRLWTETSVTYQGKYFNLKDVVCIKPVQEPHPPIWIGGNSDISLQMVAKYGDGWAGLNYPFYSYKKRETYSVEERLEKLKRYCNQFGREFDSLHISMFMHINIHSNREKAIEDVKKHYVEVRKGRVGGGGPLEHQLKWGVWGPADFVIEKIKEYEKLGAHSVVLWPVTRNMKEQWDRVENEVLPCV
jgi:alkanesulfonate monooxygenase SsuD/methylene tetrahydromethanopterin reductase-like flavin-dependent oxidoreductase (luciferase family)